MNPIIGAFARIHAPGHLTIVAIGRSHALSGQRLISRAPTSDRLSLLTHLTGLFSAAIEANNHDAAHHAAYAITSALGAPYVVQTFDTGTSMGFDISQATTLKSFLKELI